MDEAIQKIMVLILREVPQEYAQSIQSILYMVLGQYELSQMTTEVAVNDNQQNQQLVESFIVCKKIEGCTIKTLRYYHSEVVKFVEWVNKPVVQVTTNDIRRYLAYAEIERKCSKATIDNNRRCLSSFFAWMQDEDIISKNPMRKIKKIKSEKRIKIPLSDMEIETLRDNVENSRDLAIIDFLLSTGVRVSELCALNIKDVNFDSCECIVFGKGQKERYVYLNAKAQYSLKKYLDQRDDDNPALFVSLNKPHNRVYLSGVETVVRELGRKCGIENVHPHRFRRTAATNALAHGMPVEQVKEMLGHANLETTMIYLNIKKEDVKSSHKKYVT